MRDDVVQLAGHLEPLVLAHRRLRGRRPRVGHPHRQPDRHSTQPHGRADVGRRTRRLRPNGEETCDDDRQPATGDGGGPPHRQHPHRRPHEHRQRQRERGPRLGRQFGQARHGDRHPGDTEAGDGREATVATPQQRQRARDDGRDATGDPVPRAPTLRDRDHFDRDGAGKGGGEPHVGNLHATHARRPGRAANPPKEG